MEEHIMSISSVVGKKPPSPKRRPSYCDKHIGLDPNYKRRYYYRSKKQHQQYQQQQQHHQGPRFQRPIICSNCNGYGHFFKDCKKPIQSYGMLSWTLLPKDGAVPVTEKLTLDAFKKLYKTGNYTLNVCLIQRRHTISFEAFVRGKYNNFDELIIHRDRMTKYEHESIRKNNWDELYNMVMNNKDMKFVQREKRRAKALYDTVNLKEFLGGAKVMYAEPSWEFPKGRKFSSEDDITCALREFEEETGVPICDVLVTDTKISCNEEFCGTNKRIYINKYFVGLVNPNSKGPFVDPENFSQTSEVRSAKWFSFEAAMNILHPYCKEKREVLESSYKYIVGLLSH